MTAKPASFWADEPIRAKTHFIGTRKGGVGKTSTTANLAAEAARLGATVLVIDFDPQSDLSVLMGADPNEDTTISDVLRVQHEASIDTAAIDAADAWQPRDDLAYARGGALVSGGHVGVIPSDNFLPRELALLMSEKRSWPTWLRRLLKDSQLGEHVDLILLDTNPSLGESTLPAWLAAAWVTGITSAEALAVRALDALRDFADDIADEDFPGAVTEVLAVMVNRVNPRRIEDRQQVRLAASKARAYFASEDQSAESDELRSDPPLGRIVTPLLDERTRMTKLTNLKATEGGAPLASLFQTLSESTPPSTAEDIERHRGLLNGFAAGALTLLRASRAPLLDKIAAASEANPEALAGIWPAPPLPDFAAEGDEQ